MSLQVWLPLNGDLTQQGLSDIEVTNNNATVSNEGKIGKSYYFNGNKQWLQFNDTFKEFYNNDWSFAAWLKPTDSTRSIILSEYYGSGASNIAIELTAARVIRVYWAGSPDINFTTAGGLPINTWTHVAICKKNNHIDLYFNGNLMQSYDGTLTNHISNCQPRIGDDYRGNSGNTVSYQGYMNDFRLYDHCLSIKEIKELSKGLVLHYKLNDLAEEYGNTVFDSSGYNYNGEIIGSLENDGSNRYNYSTKSTNGANNYIIGPVMPSSIQSYSCWIKGNKSAGFIAFGDSVNELAFGFVSGNAYSSCYSGSKQINLFSGTNFINNEWNHIVVINDGTNHRLYINGVETSTISSKDNFIHNDNHLYLFRRNYNTNYVFNGNISDFRAYATILSDDDILELYHTAASIDNQGNLFCGEVVE